MNKRRSSNRGSKPQKNHIRIIAGRWRGRRLPVIDGPGLRPSSDRVRETLFNWLQADLPGSHCLDCFAGTGALGFEAASRGAQSVRFIEQNPRLAQQIQSLSSQLQPNQQAKALQSSEPHTQLHCHQGDALAFLQSTPPERYDVVFVDPPFALNLWSPCCELLENRGWLAAGALIYIESPREKAIPVPSKWRLWKEKSAGQLSFRLYSG